MGAYPNLYAPFGCASRRAFGEYDVNKIYADGEQGMERNGAMSRLQPTFMCLGRTLVRRSWRERRCGCGAG